MTREYVIKLSNLRNYGDEKLKDSITNLFNDHLNISLTTENVDLGQERQLRYATIYLKTHDEVEQTIDKLYTRSSREQLDFKFKSLVGPNDELQVERLKFYRQGQSLGNKNKAKEYRAGNGNYVEEKLKSDVIRFMCGFLNCLGRGILYIGVNRKGHVIGWNYNQGEMHQIQSITDRVFKSVRPVIQSNCFNVEFIPVYDSDGYPKVGCKIVEISVQNVRPTCLYSVYDEVYVRLERCVDGPLTVSEILALAREMQSNETKAEIQKILKGLQDETKAKLEQEKAQLVIKMNKELKDEREKLQKEKELEIEKLQHKSVPEPPKADTKPETKVCVIM